MADNYLESKYEDYLRQKAKKEAARRLAFHKRMVAYRKSLARQNVQDSPDDGSTSSPK
jgi:hypothetical protein